MPAPAPVSLSAMLTTLKAAGEETRLRILALLTEGELNVSDLTDILAQSQPRISRHLRLLTEAGLIERQREGAWAFFRLADHSAGAVAVRDLVSRLDVQDTQLQADRERLQAVRRARADAAQAHFSLVAGHWDAMRSLHVPEEAVEGAIHEALASLRFNAVLDLGTGTGRMLQLIAAQAERAVGVDANHGMLAVARANLERAGLSQVQLRQGDIHALPVERNAFDLVVIHQVLHYLDDPARAIREATAALAPGGRLLIVDFAAHELEFLREKHAHRRLGFTYEQMTGWLEDAGLDVVSHRDLTPPNPAADQLTVSLYLARDRRIITDTIPDQPLHAIA
ncbi:ArsR/SmtB family transcription factor [Pseudochelatococcus contaminans]|uniref:Ubiquinone/menaquinone biosynthesis C-methylase UbiE n=1 Tax=Pseudochelatococcus contaminans TaxID=1538103 RepID=A0A7W5Z2M4_9HYPH|nr:metalloregulator ArsR/SmtB family transcription factor [Pseudochelatococcus contaminans]MBB3808667.1 ubiquinone/menaquinone biosynthesis C-methylase UbiE [Pseudochelatococcus contaminans]